jgi:hypothetical protein
MYNPDHEVSLKDVYRNRIDFGQAIDRFGLIVLKNSA